MADFCEHVAKRLLSPAGISIPAGMVVRNADDTADAVRAQGPCMLKVQVPTGKRGKSGGIRPAATAQEARHLAAGMLGSEIAGHVVDTLLVEEQLRVRQEFYASVICDPVTGGPLILFSTAGGMDVEEVSATSPHSMLRIPVDISRGPDATELEAMLDQSVAERESGTVAGILASLYRVFRTHDAELVEVNPLAVLEDGRVMALDCKLVVDDASLHRQPELAGQAASQTGNRREAAAREAGLTYIELDGPVGILANGAGLTMTTMDVVSRLGGRPGNFLEIGGEAYTKGKLALQILLGHPGIRSLLVNFCGAFARTDVMAESIAQAWRELDPDIPVFFTIHGTGSREAVECIRNQLGLEPYERMDDAVRAAVAAAKAGR